MRFCFIGLSNPYVCVVTIAGPLVGFLFRETNVFGPRLALMRREYDIEHDEAYDAMRRQYKIYDWTTSAIFIVLMVVVTVLLVVLPS